MAGFLEATASSSDAEGGDKLPDRAAAVGAADLGLASQADKGLELFFAGWAMEFVERHEKTIVKDFRLRDKGGFGEYDPAGGLRGGKRSS